MKYFNKFDSFQHINEYKDQKPSLMKRMFVSLSKAISTSFKKAKLSNLSKQYNKYLYSVYAEYMIEKQLELEQGDLKDIDTDDMVKMFKAEIPKEENQEIKIQADLDEVKDELQEETEEENEGDIEEDDVEVKPEDNDIIKMAQNDKGQKVNISKFRITHADLKNNVNPEDIPTVKRYLANIVTIDGMISEYINEIDEIDEYFQDYNIKKREVMATMRGMKTDRDELQKEVDSISREMNYMNDQKDEIETKIKNLEHKKSEYINNIPKELGLIDKMNEKVSWTGGGIFHQNWTGKDKEIITNMVNVYYVEDIYLKAENIIGDDKNLAKSWESKINNVHKEWFYVYNVEEIRNKRKKMFTDELNKKRVSDSKRSEEENKKEFKNSVTITQLLETLFKNDINPYSSKEDYYKINSDDNKYYIMPFGYDDNMKLFLLEKQFFVEKEYKYVFKILAELDFNNSSQLYITNVYDDSDYNEELTLNNRTIELYKEQDQFPVIMIYENYFVSFENNNDYFDMYLVNLYSIEKGLIKEIVNNNRSNSIGKVDQLSKEIIEKAKNYRI